MNRIILLSAWLTLLAIPGFTEKQKLGGIDFYSDIARYDGKNLLLNGNVVIDHPLGQVASGAASVIGSYTVKDEPYQIIKLQDGVTISLENGSQLLCNFGDINARTCSCVFAGTLPHNFVTYKDKYYDHNNHEIPIELKCLNMNVKLSSKPYNDHKLPNYFISNIYAQNAVSIQYGSQLLAFADQAIYHRIKQNYSSSGSKQFSGLIFLHPVGEKGTCRLQNQLGDYVDSNEIRVDTNTQKLSGTGSQGELTFSQGDLQSESMHFAADNITWDALQDTLTLEHNIFLKHKKAGKFNCDGEMTFYRSDANKENSWNKIISTGASKWSYLDILSGNFHTISCKKTFLIDLNDQSIIMESPDNQDILPRQMQVSYQDRFGKIHGDTLTMNYKVIDNQIRPNKMILKGNVQILNDTPFDADDDNTVLQYALAEIAEYNPDTETVELRASQNCRVLFFDEINNVQVSADSITIKRDEVTGKESISSQGNVRLAFSDDEFLKLKNNFNVH
ncbi:MAG: hypothetical protein ACQEP8_04095 [Chlamydiota bacterium]